MALMLGRSQTGGTSYIDAGDVSNTCFGNVSIIYISSHKSGYIDI